MFKDGKACVQILLAAALLPQLIGTAAAQGNQAASGESMRVMTLLFSGDLKFMQVVTIIFGFAFVGAMAHHAFARGNVMVFDVPTMPRYTVPRSTFNYFNITYVLILLCLAAVIMEYYGPLSAWLKGIDGRFGWLPGDGSLVFIPIGAAAIVALLQYGRIPNTKFGPAQFFEVLRATMHRRARVPAAAQSLANQLMSNEIDVFEVPLGARTEVVDHPEVSPSVQHEDFGADSHTIDFQWAVTSYLFVLGRRYTLEAPYQSFADNSASLWPQILVDYNSLKPRIGPVKAGQGGQVVEMETQSAVEDLRKRLAAFHACLHLYAISNDVSRAVQLKKIGLKRRSAYFNIDMTMFGKFLCFVVFGIVVPPLAFFLYASLSNDPSWAIFSKPQVIGTWVAVGAPMYVLPAVMVFLLKRHMRNLWPIRVHKSALDDWREERHLSDFKYDIYIFVFCLSFILATVPLVVDAWLTPRDSSLMWALTPALASVCLAVLIDFDAVDYGKAPRPVRPRGWVLVARACGYAILLGLVVAYLTQNLPISVPKIDIDKVTLIFAVTAAFLGVMIGIQSEFKRNLKVIGT